MNSEKKNKENKGENKGEHGDIPNNIELKILNAFTLSKALINDPNKAIELIKKERNLYSWITDEQIEKIESELKQSENKNS